MSPRTTKPAASRRSPITTHVLDTARGLPADRIAVLLEMQVGGKWRRLSRKTTNADGRVPELLPPTHRLARGVYRLTFNTAAYFRRQRTDSFYPTAQIVFQIRNPRQHYHVPLLLSPFGYSTYRGS